MREPGGGRAWEDLDSVANVWFLRQAVVVADVNCNVGLDAANVNVLVGLDAADVNCNVGLDAANVNGGVSVKHRHVVI